MLDTNEKKERLFNREHDKVSDYLYTQIKVFEIDFNFFDKDEST